MKPASRRACLVGLGGLAGLACLSAPPCHAARPADLQGFTENLPPMSYGEAGQARGYAVDVVKALARLSGLDIPIQVMPWARAYRSGLSTPDSLLFTLVRTPEREALFHWLGPIAERRILLYRLAKRVDIRVDGLEAARRYRIGVVREDAAALQLIASGFRMNHELDGAVDDFNNMKKLLAHRVDLVVALDFGAHFMLKHFGLPPDTLVPAWVLNDTQQYFIGVNRQTQPALIARLEQALATLKSSGELTRIRAGYLGTTGL